MKLCRVRRNETIGRAAFAHLLRFNVVNTVREYEIVGIVMNGTEVNLEVFFGFQLVDNALQARYCHLAANIGRQCGLDLSLDLGVVQRTKTRRLEKIKVPADNRHRDQFFHILREGVLII